MGNEKRQPHAVLDLPSRSWKAEKIARLLDLANLRQPMRLLEIGTGSGGIAHWFAHHPQLRCDVVAVDVCDNRKLHEGYAFQQASSCRSRMPVSMWSSATTSSNTLVMPRRRHATYPRSAG